MAMLYCAYSCRVCSVSFGVEAAGRSPKHEMVEGVWEVVFSSFLIYAMLPLRLAFILFCFFTKLKLC